MNANESESSEQPYFRVTVALPSALDRLCATRCILPTHSQEQARVRASTMHHTVAFIFGWEDVVGSVV